MEKADTVGEVGGVGDRGGDVLGSEPPGGGRSSRMNRARRRVAGGARQVVAAAAVVGSVKGWRIRTSSRAAFDRTKERAGQTLSAAQALVASDLSGSLNRLVAAAVKGAPTVYDKAMDANYLDPAQRSGLGGSYHRLFDGGHSIAGAARAAREVSADDTVVQEALGTVKALMKDASTPRGCRWPPGTRALSIRWRAL